MQQLQNNTKKIAAASAERCFHSGCHYHRHLLSAINIFACIIEHIAHLSMMLPGELIKVHCQ